MAVVKKQSAVDREWERLAESWHGLSMGDPTRHVSKRQLAAIIRRARKAALQEAIEEVDADSLRTDYDHPIKWARDAVERVKP